METLKEGDQTASYVKNKIQIAEMKNNSEHSEQRLNIIAAKKDQVEEKKIIVMMI